MENTLNHDDQGLTEMATSTSSRRVRYRVADEENSGYGENYLTVIRENQPDAIPKKTSTKSEFSAERSVVSAVLADNSNYVLVSSVLTALDFSDSICASVYAAIQEIIEGNVHGVTIADPITVSARPGVVGVVSARELAGWSSAFKASGALEESVTSWAKTVSSVSMSRNLSKSLDKARTLMSDDRSIEEKAEEIGRIVSGAVEIKGSGPKGIGEFAASAASKMIEQAYREPGEITGVATGFEDLDAKTSGLRGGNFIIVAARPAMGKTSFALSIALNAAKSGHGILMCSLEMSGEELATRIISTTTKIDATKLKNSALTEDEWDSVANSVEYLSTLSLHLDDQAKLGIAELRASARLLKRNGKLDLIVVDYIQLMDGNPKIQRPAQISEISRGLKLLAKELDVPVIALSQLNRDVEKRPDKRPIMSDLRESGALEQDADLILFLYRDEVYNKSTNDVGVAEIIIGKNRSGPDGTVRAVFDSKTASYINGSVTKNVENQAKAQQSDRKMSEFMENLINRGANLR